MEDYIQQVLAFDAQQGTATRVEKMVAFYTSRDPAVSDTLVRAARSAARHADFAAAFERHTAAWDELWQVCDMRVSGDQSVQQLLRLHIAHVLQVCSRSTPPTSTPRCPPADLTGRPIAGTCSGMRSKAFPFFNVRLPEVTRGLLMYRDRRMGEAGAAAHETGFRGAMFPWQSGSEGVRSPSGSTSTPSRASGSPTSAATSGTSTRRFLNIWHYFQTTHDQAFLATTGRR